MSENKLALRPIFEKYGRLALGAGLILLAALGLLRVFNWLINWNEPLDWFTLAGSFIVIAALLGPYAVTVGQLKGVQRIRVSTIKSEVQSDPGRQRLILITGLVVAVIFLGLIIWSRSLTIWLTFGSGLSLMGLVLYYLAWQIGRIEKKANITIYPTDYTWRFDKTSYIGVLKK